MFGSRSYASPPLAPISWRSGTAGGRGIACALRMAVRCRGLKENDLFMPGEGLRPGLRIQNWRRYQKRGVFLCHLCHHRTPETIFHFTLRRERCAGDDGDAEIRTFPIMTRRFPVWGSLEKLTLTPTALRFGVSLLRAPDRALADCGHPFWRVVPPTRKLRRLRRSVAVPVQPLSA